MINLFSQKTISIQKSSCKVHLIQIILLIQKIDAKMMPVGAKLEWCVVSMEME
jgi:hypothetical protein